MIDVEDPGHRFVSLTTLLFAGGIVGPNVGSVLRVI